MKMSTSSNRALAGAAERQMRNWALDLQTQQQVAEARETMRIQELIHPYVAISRETGVDALSLAQGIADKCGWKVLDRELLDYMAEHEHFSRLALEFVDERTVSWFHEMFGKWLDKELVSQAEYVSRLGKLVMLAAQHDSKVFVGRGVQFMLPRECGLAVRIIATLEQRVNCIMKKRNYKQHQAKKFVEITDLERSQFVERYFHRDVRDPHLYDLTINLEKIPREVAVELIASAAKKLETRWLREVSGLSSAERQFRRLDNWASPK
jgi:cytidylate kinase